MSHRYKISESGAETTTFNSGTIVEVSQASDLPSTLVANTTYIVRGIITLTSPISVTNSGCSIIGTDRNRDKLIWDGATGTTMLTITDVDFDLENLWLSSNNTGSVLIEADNHDSGTYNDGRLKVLTMTNCQFRNCFDVMSVDGFDLVDIQNTLFWYCEAPNFGVKFTNTSKIEVSSCEFIRWFRESSLPTPANYATCPMIELIQDTSNFGAVNITGNIFHPQQTQEGLLVAPTSVTGFGTFSGNTFVNVGLTPNIHVAKIVLSGASGTANVLIGGYQNYLATHNVDIATTCTDFATLYENELLTRYGIAITTEASGGGSTDTLVFSGAVAGNVFAITSITNVSLTLTGVLTHTTPLSGVVTDLDLNAQRNYIVQANQGVLNGNSKGTLSIIGNTNDLDTGTTNPQVLNATNVGGAFTSPPTFPVGTRVITDRDACSITYSNKNKGSFFVSVSATVEMAGNGFIACRLRSDSGSGAVVFTHAIGLTEIKSGIAESFTFSIIGQANLGDVFDIEFEAFNASMVSTPNDIKVREFVLNGYQF